MGTTWNHGFGFLDLETYRCLLYITIPAKMYPYENVIMILPKLPDCVLPLKCKNTCLDIQGMLSVPSDGYQKSTRR